MNHWPTAPLEELCEFKNGLWKGKKPPYVYVGVIRNTNFTPEGYLDDSDIAYHDVEAKQFEKRRLIPGDIILEKSGGGPKQPVGRVIIFEKEDGEYSFSNFTSYIRIKDRSKLDPHFLHKLLYHYYVSGATETMQKRSTGIRNLIFPEYKQLAVPLPPLPEQRRIVSVLDAAFAGLATATANTQKNLQNARELFESYADNIFRNGGENWDTHSLGNRIDLLSGFAFKSRGYTDSDASIRLLRGDNIMQGYFRWDKAKRWPIAERDVYKRYELEEGDVVLAMDRTWIQAGVKYAVMKAEDLPCLLVQRVARLRPRTIGRRFLAHLLGSRLFTDYVLSIQTGLGVPHISGKQIQDFVYQAPSEKEQIVIGTQLDDLKGQSESLIAQQVRKLAALEELKQSILHRAFRGELSNHASVSPIKITSDVDQGPFPFPVDGISKTDLHAGILAMAHECHAVAGKIDRFGHVKAEKQAHMIEAVLGIDLGRKPMKEAMGPNDFPRLQKVEHRARMANYFNFKRDKQGGRYKITKYDGFDRLIAKTRGALSEHAEEVEKLLKWMTPLKVQQAEIVATVYAGWNNLLLDGLDPTDEDIVTESRENWHAKKLEIDRDKFFKAIGWLRKEGVIPVGRGRRVNAKA